MNSEGLGPSKKMLENRSVLRWGGLAGLLSAGMTVLSLLTIVASSTPLFVPVQPGDPCGPSCYVGASLPDFPANRAALMTHHAFYVLTIMLIAILVVSLYRVLSRESSSIAPALSGFAIGLLGLAMLATGGWVSISFAHLSDVYHTSNPQDQATLVLVSHAVQAVFNETDVMGGIMLSVGFILFGVAMLRNPSFGKLLGVAGMVLGLVAIGGIAFRSIGQDNPDNPFFIIVVLVLPLIYGLKLYRLSRSSMLSEPSIRTSEPSA
jgi:hypothetical protein